jgi:Flp pilus assembly protein TadG
MTQPNSVCISTHRGMLRDRRGAASLLFSVTAVAFIGVAGLATEGGTWYLERRHGQNAADAAAIAGVLAIANGGTSGQAVTAGTSVATSNFYTAGTNNGIATGVTIAPGNYSGTTFTPGAAPLNAVKATITRSPPRMFSSVFLGNGTTTIGGTAVATLATNGGNACVVGGIGSPPPATGLLFSGSTSLTLNNCSAASNSSGGNSIQFNGNKATVSGGTLVSSGGCSNCGNSPGYLAYQLPATDPFSAIYDPQTGSGVTIPTFSGTTCTSLPAVGGTAQAPTQITPYDTNGHKGYCSSGNGPGSTLKTSNGDYLNFAPGTYFFQNISLDFTGGTVECTQCAPGGAGVTIILTGTSSSKVGTLSIGGSATVTLNAPATNAWNGAFDGVLFYTSSIAQPTNGNGNAPVSILGNGNIQLTGGMYFPTVNVNFSGDVTSASACTELIAYQVDFTGNSTLNVAGCGSIGTPVALVRSVQLVL